jgi:hypothetical protein
VRLAVAAGSAVGRLGAAQADSKIKTEHNTPLNTRGYIQCIFIFSSHETGSTRFRRRINFASIFHFRWMMIVAELP